MSATKKKIIRWILATIFTFLGFGLVSWLCYQCGNPLNRVFFLTLLGVEATILAIIAGIFTVGKTKNLPSDQLFKKFITWPLVIFLLITMGVTLTMAIVSKEAPASDNDVTNADSAPPSTDDESSKEPMNPKDPALNQGDQKEPPEPNPYLSLAEWESDAFLLSLDKYCGYHVKDEDAAAITYSLISNCLEEIPVRGRYNSALLEGQDSEYAQYTARANELYHGYGLLSDAQILVDKQFEFLKEEIENRKSADKLYQVSDNERTIGDSYLKLGNASLSKGDISDAHDNYVQAFSWFQTTFRTAVAEGADSATLDAIYRRIVNTKDKLLNLDGIDSREKNMAPKIVYAFEQILAEN